MKLRKRYPNARIDWLITPENAELIRHHPDLSNIVLFPRRQATVWRIAKLLNELRREKYDLVIDLHGQARSAVFTVATLAPIRIGFDRPRRRSERVVGWQGSREGAWMAYSHCIPIRRVDVHAVDRYLWLSPILALDESPPDFTIHLEPHTESKVADLLARNGLTNRQFVILAPGTIWETKHWRAEGFAEVGRELIGRGLAVVVAGAPGDRESCQAVIDSCPGAIDLCGQTTLSEYAALAKRAVASVTNDSGSMHLAVALGRPVVSVFGPTDPVRVGPYNQPNSVVRVESLPCLACYLRSLRWCPNDHACMQQVSGPMVLDRLDEILSGKISTKAPGLRLAQ